MKHFAEIACDLKRSVFTASVVHKFHFIWRLTQLALICIVVDHKYVILLKYVINISVLWMQFKDELILFLSKYFPGFIKDKWCDQFYSIRNTLRIVWFNFAEKDQMIQLFQLINSRMKKLIKTVCWCVEYEYCLCWEIIVEKRN